MPESLTDNGPEARAGGRSRARRTQRLELHERHAAQSVTSKTPGWERWPPALRFHSSYAVVPGAIPGSDCWHWIGVISDEGYGQFTVGGETHKAHRYALEKIARRGPLGKRRVYRRCGDTSCVNPDHLTFSQAPEVWPVGVVAPRIGNYSLTPIDVDRFWSHADKEAGSPCWLWTGAINRRTGYGAFTAGGKQDSAHRTAYAIANGSVPKGLSVCHGPDCEARGEIGRLCVNPEHLIADTPAANRADRNGGHFRRPLRQIPVTAETRAVMSAFMPHSIAVENERGNLDDDACLEEMYALDAAVANGAADPLFTPPTALQHT